MLAHDVTKYVATTNFLQTQPIFGKSLMISAGIQLNLFHRRH